MRKSMLLRQLVVFFQVFLITGVALVALDTALAAPPEGPPIPPEIDTSPPDQTPKLVFVHASVGGHWLKLFLGGRLDRPEYYDISLGGNNYFVSDHYADEPPGHDYCDWRTVFSDEAIMDMLYHHDAIETDPAYDRPMADPGGENAIIMIKPCFGQSHICGNPDDPPTGNHRCTPGCETVGDVKQVMIDVLEIFRQHPDKFFVLVTAPPLKQEDISDPKYDGENPRAVANWMVHEWLDGYDVGNVMVFDLFNVLTSNADEEGDPCQEWHPDPEFASDVGLETGNHHRIWNGQIQHQVQYDQNYSAYCWGHPIEGAHYKATSEFVPLLNAYYNAWVAGESPTVAVGKSVNQGRADYGDVVTYTISLAGTGRPITVTDPLPSGLAYRPDSAGVVPEIGALSVEDNSLLRWTGTLTADVSLQITFGATVVVTMPTVIQNTAFIKDGEATSESSATVIANGYKVYLPIIVKD